MLHIAQKIFVKWEKKHFEVPDMWKSNFISFVEVHLILLVIKKNKFNQL